MEARYIGDPERKFHGPRTLTLFGKTFIKGKWSDVSGLKPNLAGKLAGNNHFQVREPGAPEPAMPEAEEQFETPVEDTLTEELGDEATDSTVSDAPVPADKEALIAELEGLKAKYDARWGVPKLQQALEAARFVHGDSDDEE